MSSEKGNVQGTGLRSSRLRPTASIARSITWSFWWRKVLSWLCFDVLLVAFVAAIFTWHCAMQLPTSALDGIEIEKYGIRVINPMNWGFQGSSADVSTWMYRIDGGDGRPYYFAVEPYLRVILPYAIAAVVYQALDIVDFFSDTRRVRRQLQPLNDLAVMADSLGNAGVVDPMMGDVSADKMATLEQAIARASVDSPTVTTGDQDLRSIEVALNGLLRQMQEAKLQQMRFVSDASHELRTPIAVIQGYANMLDRWGKSDEKILEEGITAIRNEADHMNYLVEQLLFLARGDSGRTSLNRQQVRTDELMTEIYEESLMIDEKHRYRLSNSGLWEEVLIDPGLMKQAVRILVDNAAKYTPEGEEIQLSYGINEKGSPYLQVQDLGQGISESELPHIFERFFRADEARGSAGTGLGLSIAKWIVDKHEGHFEVLSVRDLGTRIRIVL